MRRGLLMVLIGGTFTLLGLFSMPMKRANPRQNLIDNPFGWGLFGFGLSSLLVGISAMSKEKKIEITDIETTETFPMKRVEVKQGVMKQVQH